MLLCVLAGVSAAGETAEGLSETVRRAKERVFPALVHIVNVEEAFAHGRSEKSISAGSGFLIDAEGHIVTNYHVAGEGKILVVTLASKRKLNATLVAGDPYTDVALLKVDPQEAFAGGAPVFATLGASSRLQEGDFVLAMGSPLSLSRSVSFGIISCRERALDTMRVAGHETGKYNTWLQTDAAINPGNSGGPLVNMDGEVVGVNTRANLLADNIGFAIPSDVVREVVAALKAHGEVPRAYLGLKLQPLGAVDDTALAAGREGALVAAVDVGSPAALAGVRPGDVVTALNGEPFSARFDEELPALYARIARLEVGKLVRLKLRRGSDERYAETRPAPLGRHLGRESEVSPWGITVRGITARMRLELGLRDGRGVLVTGVRPGGPASGKLEEGDVVREVNGEPVDGLAEFLRAAAGTAEDGLVRLVFHRGSVLDVTVVRPREGR